MRVGVTGAGGFVGRRVCETLSQQGYVVVPLTRAPSGISGEIEIGDLGMLTSPPMLPMLDAIVHLAARTHMIGERDAADAYRRTNVDGTRQLIEAAHRAGVSRFIFMSSIKVNGEQTLPGQAFTEADEPAPSDAYGISKLEAENVVRDLCKEYGIRWTIIRPPLVYGAGVKANFRKLAQLAVRGLPLPLGATGNLRSLIHVDNLADFTIKCLTDPRANDELFLISDGQDVSTDQLLRRMARSAGQSVRLFPVPKSVAATVARWMGQGAAFDRLFGDLRIDSAKARGSLEWMPTFDLDDGLATLMTEITSAD
jgi:nucleoside-diphosphate-sugar epimerase